MTEHYLAFLSLDQLFAFRVYADVIEAFTRPPKGRPVKLSETPPFEFITDDGYVGWVASCVFMEARYGIQQILEGI